MMPMNIPTTIKNVIPKFNHPSLSPHLSRGVHYDNIRKQRAGKYGVIYIHKKKNLEFS